jgi:hypothetical protein
LPHGTGGRPWSLCTWLTLLSFPPYQSFFLLIVHDGVVVLPAVVGAGWRRALVAGLRPGHVRRCPALREPRHVAPGDWRQARRVKLLSPTAIAQADGSCDSLPVGPFSPLTGLLRGPMLAFSPLPRRVNRELRSPAVDRSLRTSLIVTSPYFTSVCCCSTVRFWATGTQSSLTRNSRPVALGALPLLRCRW